MRDILISSLKNDHNNGHYHSIFGRRFLALRETASAREFITRLCYVKHAKQGSSRCVAVCVHAPPVARSIVRNIKCCIP